MSYDLYKDLDDLANAIGSTLKDKHLETFLRVVNAVVRTDNTTGDIWANRAAAKEWLAYQSQPVERANL